MKGKRILAALLSAALCVVPAALAGCGGGRTPGYTPVVDDLKFDEWGDPIFFDDNGKPIQLKVWSIIGEPDNRYYDVINGMFNDYYKTSGVSAKVTPIATGDFYTQFAHTVSDDEANAPDVVIFHSERLPSLVENNLLRPYEEFYSALGDKNTFSANNYLDAVMDECVYQDKVYGVPLDVHSGVWFCRRDILEKNGLTVPSTLSEFVDVNNKLIEKYNNGSLWFRAMTSGGAEQCAWKRSKDFGDTYNPVVMSAAGGIETGWIPQTAVFQNGGVLAGADGKPAWNNTALESVMQMFRDWQTGEGDFKGTPYSGAFVADNNDYNTVWSKLSKGEAVFSFEGPWWVEKRLDEYEEVLANLEDNGGVKYERPLEIINPSKMFALDENSASAGKVYGVGHCVSVCRTVTSKTKCVAAALYAQYVTENSAEYTQGGHLPACKKVLESEKFKSMPCYSRYLNRFTAPEDFVMLGSTPHYAPVYEGLKLVYADVFTASKRTITVKNLIDARYEAAMNEISAGEGL